MRQESRESVETTARARLTAERRALITTHFELIDRLTPMIRALDRRIRTIAAAQLLATIPSIGPYRSLLLAAELEPIDRFPGHTRHGNIRKGANRWVRGALVSAIPTHVRCAPESAVTRSYDRLKAQLGWRRGTCRRGP